MSNQISLKTTISLESFWQSINILLTKPHVVNKRVWGSKILFKLTCRPLQTDWEMPLKCPKLNNIEQGAITYLLKKLKLQNCDEVINNSSSYSIIEVTLIELLPKAYTDNHAFQLVCLNKNDGMVAFFDLTPDNVKQDLTPDFPYTLKLNNNEVILNANFDDNSKSYKWLIDTVLPQLIKWAEENENNRNKQKICNESLCLVSVDKYYKKYNDLKLKYGKELVKIWPECTDPSKFVYEDVAIATYLLLLWEDERRNSGSEKLQTFVDLGCGNGLLVYILAMEEHQGVGIDVRKRQIWKMYPDNVILHEKTIIPSDTNLFPKTDWIIGNHSDELTPWIPVLAARSSYKCKFFLLPCCAYNFDGTKYQRQDSSKSQYNDYLEYVKAICDKCGFRTDIDRLKIPSTKRICLVSRERTYTEEHYDKYVDCIQNLINSDTNQSHVLKEQADCNIPWIKEFKPRETTEKVRNCTQININVIKSIVNTITKYLLENCSFEGCWCKGKTAEFKELVQIIPEDQLKVLKSECGGLQTLLKNNHNIFLIQNGKVQLRYPKTIDEVRKSFRNKSANLQIQQKPCWFYNNHPQGCPLLDQNCSYLHVRS